MSGTSLRLAEIARWIAVLPAALMGALLVSFPVHWAVMLISLFDRPDESAITVNGKGLLASIDPQVLERFGYALFVPMVLIVVGAKVAPRFKFQTGIALAILWGVLFGAAVTLALTNGPFEWKMLIAFGLAVVGVTVGLTQAHKS
jgi:hypothetical protein